MLKTRVRVTSCLLWVVLTYLGFYSPNPANAETSNGLNAVGYVIDQVPPEQSDSIYPTCGSELENNINRSFDWEPFAQCPNDLFMVHYSGYITLPQHQTIQFMVAADDGGTISIGGNTFGDWHDKGCSWYYSDPMSLPSETSLSLDGWFYENGGGTCYMLAWSIDGQGWQIVPDSAFTTEQVATTTTTTTTTTTSTTTTTVPETTTTVPDTTTTQPVRTTTTTEPVTVVATTTTEVPVPQTTTTAVPPVVVSTTMPPTTTSTEVPVTTSSSTTLAPVVPTDTSKITTEQAIAVVTNAEVLKQLTSEQAVDVFDAVQPSELSDEQAAQLVAAVQNAPEEVRVAFESQINVFGGKFDSYVPIGSKVSVRQRKVIVAASGVLFMAPTVSVSSSTSGSQSDSRKRR